MIKLRKHFIHTIHRVSHPLVIQFCTNEIIHIAEEKRDNDIIHIQDEFVRLCIIKEESLFDKFLSGVIRFSLRKEKN